MTSLPKNNNKCRIFPKPNKIYFIRKVLMRAIQKCTLLNLSHYVKSYGHFCQILAIFTMLAHQIWSCHVTQEPNFENFLFCPDSIFNIGEITKFLVETFSLSNFIRQEPYEGMENTPLPVLLGLTWCIWQRSRRAMKNMLNFVLNDLQSSPANRHLQF